jgi:hypothetical protein
MLQNFYNCFVESQILSSLISGCFTAIGAFIPFFLLMIVHYLSRKSSYKSDIPRLNSALKSYKTLSELIDKEINFIYESAGVTDATEYFERMKHNKVVLEAGIKSITKSLDESIKNSNKIADTIEEIEWKENYSFRTYLGGILERRFPEHRSRV